MLEMAVYEKELFDPWNSIKEHIGNILLQFSCHDTLIEIYIFSLILVVLSQRISFNSVITEPFQKLLSNRRGKLEVLKTITGIIDSCMVVKAHSAYIEPTKDYATGAHDAWVEGAHNCQVLGFRQVETSLVSEIPVHDPHFTVASRVKDPPLPLLNLLEDSVTA
jgi:hypothetical protein